MPQPTDDRIAAALAQGARISDVTALIEDLQTEIGAADADAKRLDDLSIAITTKEADAEQAVDEANKARRRVTRLSAKVTALRERVSELEASNRRKAAETAYAAAQKTRDALVKDLKDKWPKLTGQMIDLFERIQASDAECARLGSCYGKPQLVSAEALARNCLPSFVLPDIYQSIPRLTSMKLFALDASTSMAVTYGIWPPRADTNVQ